MTSCPSSMESERRRLYRGRLFGVATFGFMLGMLVFSASRSAAQETLTNVMMDVLGAVESNAATLSATPFDLGYVNEIFDGSPNTLARTPNINPAFVQVNYTQLRTITRLRVHLSYGTSYQWWVEKADSQSDLEARIGSYAVITSTNSLTSGNWGEQTVAPVTARIFRLNVRRFGGDGYCHINEWQLYGNVEIDRIDVSPPYASLYYGDVLQFHAFGYNSLLKESYNIASVATWKMDGAVGTLTSTGLFTAGSAGEGTIIASVGALSSAPATVVVQQSEPDIDVLYIERTPRLAFDPVNTSYTSGLPVRGQDVTYRAHVKNWGTEPVSVAFEWWFDGALSSTGTVVVPPGQELLVPYTWKWETNNHSLEFRADPRNTLYEVSKLNNRVRIRTNALLVGLWVEQSLYNHFHASQLAVHDGANSFEDWGQRMIDRWNYYFQKARFPVSPEGFLDTVALDKVTVVPDYALPLAGGLSGNNPDSRDRTVDMQWGYPWDSSDTNAGAFYGFRWSGPFFIDFGSIHEMNHARYHVDLYALDENHNASSPNVPLIDDDTGQLVVGTSKMPFIAWDVVYYNKWRDIMGAGPPFFDAYSAGAWNWKHHRRGQGNQNAPPDLGRFLDDLPSTNHVRFIDQQGVPLAGAEVWLYRTGGGFYSKVFNNTPAASYVTDAQGTMNLGRNPFGATANFSYSSPITIFKVRYRGQLYFMFQEVTDFNIEHWLRAGRRSDPGAPQAKEGFYVREIDLRDNPVGVPNGNWLASYYNGNIFGELVSSGTNAGATGLDFTWTDAPVPGLNRKDFSVYWQGGISFTEGWKEFSITSDGGFQLLVDGRLVFDQWTNRVTQTWKAVIYTSANAPFVNPGRSAAYGNFHRVEVRYQHTGTNPGRVALSWADESPPAEVPVNAWRGDYYSTKSLSGYMLSRIDTAIQHDFGNGSPDPVLGSDNFSARWTGDWDFPGGNVTFRATADDGIRVYVDGTLSLDRWFDQPPTTYTFNRFLSPGKHRIRVDYYEAGAGAQAVFGWTLPPWIQQAPQSQTVLEGSTVILAGIASGYPNPKYYWLLEKQPISTALTSLLTLTNVQLSHSGVYTFMASNAVGNVSAEARLTVVPATAVPLLSSPVVGQQGFEVTLSGAGAWNYRLEASTNLVDWTEITNVVYGTQPVLIRDAASTNYPQRFYRAVVVPAGG